MLKNYKHFTRNKNENNIKMLYTFVIYTYISI